MINENLTIREFEVLDLLVDGYDNPEIAQHLNISVFTVRAHLRNIYFKRNTSSRLYLVISELRRRLDAERRKPLTLPVGK